MDRSDPNYAQIVDGVTQTLQGYCQFLDEARVDEFVDLFTEDCVMEEGRKAEGRQEIEKGVKRVIALFQSTSHHLSNVRVTPLDTHSADSLAYCYAWHLEHDGTHLEIWARYIDRLRLEDDGRWRIQHRVVQVAGFRGRDKLNLPRVPREKIED